MSLARPEALPFLLLAPLLWGALFALDRLRSRRLARLVGPRVHALAGERDPRTGAARRALLAGGVLLAAAAALHPLWGGAAGRIERGSLDVVVCLDVSRSMLARDLAPDRLGRAREEVRALADRAVGDRLALVVFAGEARALGPLTRDLRSLAELVGQADTVAVRRGGTDVGAALEAARELLGGRPGAIVVLTDGEDHDGRGLAAARACRAHGVPVHCIGFGTERGAKIPVDGAFLKDRTGREVISPLREGGLRRIADAAGGAYVRAAAAERALVGLYEEHILPTARESRESEERRRRENRFQWPLALAVALWVVELGLPDRRRT